MNLGKLAKRLRKELAANPKQAAVLGIVCLVALWFWGPLLLKWFGGKPPAVAKAPGGAKAPPATAAKATPENNFVKIRWFDLQAMREADPLTRPAPVAAAARNPFGEPRTTIASTGDDDAADDEDTPRDSGAVDPAKLGLSLESIAYGPKRRRAQINGQTYQENDTLEWEPKGEGQGSARLLSIHPSEVVLDVRGVPLRLRLRPKTLGQGNVVQRENPD